MEQLKQLKKRLEFKNYPADWRVLNVSVDWAGEPLVLFEEGKPPQPSQEAGLDALVHWLNIPPRAHHLISLGGSAIIHTQFANSMQALVVSHAQPFGEGWLLGEGSGGRARIFDKAGSKLLRTLDLGDASEDIQTTPEGHIWVSYFDEGVFGNGIGQNGLVCFDPDGNVIFQYADFAKQHNLPYIADCYALNVCDEQVWVCYYSDFPLVCLKQFQLENIWREFGVAYAFAVRKQQIVLINPYKEPYVVSRGIDDPAENAWKLLEPEGSILWRADSKPEENHGKKFFAAARGSRIYVWTATTLFEVS